MRGVVWACVLLLWSGVSGHAESKFGRWLRRASWGASCAASMWDISTTHSAVTAGATEGNRFFAGPQGQPRWGRIFGLKLGLCGGMAALQEVRVFGRRHPDLSNAAWTAANLTFTQRFVAVSLQNRRVSGALQYVTYRQ